MRATDLLRISSRQVLRQYRKNIGVIITIVLGTTGLIVMITMGRSVENSISNDLEIIGNATRLRVTFTQTLSGYYPVDKRAFRQTTIDGIKTIPGVTQVGSIVIRNAFGRLTYRDNVNYFKLLGVDESFWKVHGSSAQSGSLFSSEDLQQHRAICVLGQRVAYELFDQLDPIGQFVSINNTPFKVTGILDTISMPDKVRVVFLPLSTALDRISSFSPRNKLYIRCNSWDDVDTVAEKLPGMVKNFQPEDQIEIFYPKDILSRIKAISFGIKIFVELALVATFVLGGIGIWNIMMMAVRSRTREIGLKKAIGAEDHDILFQFLAESLMLSISATLIGFLLGWTGVTVMASILDNSPPKELFWLSTGIAFSFSLVLGVVAGLAPAIKASRMEVVTALRYE